MSESSSASPRAKEPTKDKLKTPAALSSGSWARSAAIILSRVMSDILQGRLAARKGSQIDSNGLHRGDAPCSRAHARLLHEIRPQCLAPVGNGGNLLLLEKNLRLLLHVGIQIGGEAGVHVDGGERLAERLLRHRI